MIYLDYAASTPIDPRVLAAMQPHLEATWGNPSSAHKKGREARAAIDESRASIAKQLDCKPQEILFTASGSEANGLAIHGVCDQWLCDHSAPGHIISQPTEHACVLQTLKDLEQKGWQVTWLNVNASGQIDVNDLKEALAQEVALVSMQWINSELGTVQPIDEITALCKEKAVPYHCDAMQGIGILPLPASLPDLFTMAAHKFYGPKGIGALVAQEHVNLQPQIRGGGQEFDLRAGTENVPGIVGLSTALTIALEEQQDHFDHLSDLRAHCLSLLEGMDGIFVRSNPDCSAPSILNLHVPGMSGETLVIQLDLKDICISTGSACATGASEPSHVLQAIGVSAQQAKEHVRVSFGKETQKQDLEMLYKKITED